VCTAGFPDRGHGPQVDLPDPERVDATAGPAGQPKQRSRSRRRRRLTARVDMKDLSPVSELGITGTPRSTPELTGTCESLIDTVRTTERNVKRCSSEKMGLSWTAGGDARSREAVLQRRLLRGPAPASRSPKFRDGRGDLAVWAARSWLIPHRSAEAPGGFLVTLPRPTPPRVRRSTGGAQQS
jgi:hypothetical protein